MPLKDKLRSRTPRDLREERDTLGFVRQQEVHWLRPDLLVRAGVEVLVSGTFGKFADKREIQREEQDPLDYSGEGELWVDYLSDTGDGWEATYTMAYLLAQPSLEKLPRGRILLMGGDQVYPTATSEEYEHRFVGPFRSALPHTEPDQSPHMYALPGNHDWYDGVVSFLRLFCARGWIGGWQTRQRRSYFALRLPNNWWVLAVDIQLDTYLDGVQLDYFASQPIVAGDKVILLTAKPAWVKAYSDRVEPPSWRYLSFFEERYIRRRGARLVVTLTGDLHHYARYEPAGTGADDAPTRITAGGGGAYLSATHTLKPKLELRSLDRDGTITYACEKIYPSDEDSRRLGNGILKLAALNPAFARLLGGIYVVLGITMLGSLNSGAGGLVQTGTKDGFVGFLGSAAGAVTLLLALLLFGGIFGGTDMKPPPLERRRPVRLATLFARLGTALAQAAAHLLLTAATVYGALHLAPEIWDATIAVWLLAVALLYVAGHIIGTTVFAFFLLLIHKLRAEKAPENANQVFAGQSIADYKNLLRMRFASDGGLTIYPLGVDSIGREWDYVADSAEGPRFVPRGHAPRAHLIDGPLRFDSVGRRVSGGPSSTI